MTKRTETSEVADNASWIQAKSGFSEILSTDAGSRESRRVARALHSKYEYEVRRWRNYESLFGFLAFVTVLMAVLYLQSNAQTSFQVHSSISAILPPTSTMASRDTVLEWIQQTLTNLWKDPVCGDGVCSMPFEFASYGRFGCRADCGKLPEIQTLTTLQIDLYYDFEHPANSISAAELMLQASWNLCPTNGAPHGMDCYYSEAQRFEGIHGEIHRTLDDVPDGLWEVHIKRDFFDKVRGAVRVADRLKEQAAWSRKYGAYLAAVADQDFEIAVLEVGAASWPFLSNGLFQEAVSVGEMAAYDYTVEHLTASVAAAQTQLEDALALGSLTQSDFDSDNQTLRYLRDDLSRRPAKSTDATTAVSESVFSGAFENETDENGDDLTTAEICQKYIDLVTAASATRLVEVQTKLSTERLGGSDGYPGKIGTRAEKKAEQRSYITTTAPELYDWVFVNIDGTTPNEDPALNTTKYDTLARYFSDGPTGFLDPSSLPFQQQLTSSAVQAANLSTLLTRSNARVAEIQRQKDEVAQMEVVQEMLQMYSSTPLAERLETELLPVFIEYNHVEWSGGPTAYLTCNLDIRGPDYIGQCSQKTECTRENNTVPYECPTATDLSEEECGQRCCWQEDCAALCACESSCGEEAVCVCAACENLVDALFTDEYRSLQELAESAEILSPGRRLQQDDSAIAERLLDLTDSVNSLRTGQEDLKTQVVSLETEVELANELTRRREEDNALQDLINQGRSEIAAGQESVEGLLVEILGKQNATLEAVEEATETVKALEEMTAKSLEAQTAIQTALREQMNAIKIAYQQNLISLDQAAELWKIARRERLVSDKDALLSTYRCASETVVIHPFEIDNYAEEPNLRSRERYIGLNNRIVAGMLLHTTRAKRTKCPDSRFEDIEDDCRRDLDTDSFGVDPVFKSGTTLYDPDLDQTDSLMHFYNCSELESPTYRRLDPYASTESYVNEAPFCMELFNMRDVPYGFRAFALEGKKKGFPVWFDINLSEYEADKWYRYLSEGLYLDGNTKSVTAEIVVFNAELNVFGYLEVLFDFTDGGAIQVSNRITAAKADLYRTSTDFFRLVLEIILTGCLTGWLLMTIWEIFKEGVTAETVLKRCVNTSWLEAGSNLLLFITVVMWWSHVLGHAKPFDIDLSYGVYASLNPPAAYLKLANNGEGLKSVNHGFNKMKQLAESLSWYYAVNGISILLLIARMLKKMDFQPRLGVVTRSISLAGSDLLHFSVVSCLVFFGYAMMAHLTFGGALLSFSTYNRSVNTCFEILLGDVSISAQLKELSGMQSVAGMLFFWSFELLVFLVLLNFLLAIIVDAFSIVKEQTSETTGIHTEILSMARHRWRQVTGWLFNSQFVPYDRLGALLHHYGTLGSDETDSDSPPKRRASIKVSPAVQSVDTYTVFQIRNEEIDAEMLRSVLYRAFETTSLDFPYQSNGSFLWPLSAPSRRSFPTDSELDAVVASLMQRLGTEDTQSSSTEPNGIESAHLNESLSRWEEELREAQESLKASLEELSSLQREILSGQQELRSRNVL